MKNELDLGTSLDQVTKWLAREHEGGRMSLEGALIDAEQYWQEGEPWTPETARQQKGGTFGT